MQICSKTQEFTQNSREIGQKTQFSGKSATLCLPEDRPLKRPELVEVFVCVFSTNQTKFKVIEVIQGQTFLYKGGKKLRLPLRHQLPTILILFFSVDLVESVQLPCIHFQYPKSTVFLQTHENVSFQPRNNIWYGCSSHFPLLFTEKRGNVGLMVYLR